MTLFFPIPKLCPIIYNTESYHPGQEEMFAWLPSSWHSPLLYSPCPIKTPGFAAFYTVDEVIMWYHTWNGLPRWLSDKECACQCRRPVFNPWAGEIPREGHGNPLQYPWVGNPMDTGAWRATVPGVARVRHDLVTEQQQSLAYLSGPRLRNYTGLMPDPKRSHPSHGLSHWDCAIRPQAWVAR